MRKSPRRARHVLALSTALAMRAPLVATSAHAEEPIVTTGIDAADDAVATVTDTALDALAGCVPAVRSWTPIWQAPAPFVASNGSVYYTEVGGGTAHLSCAAPVKIVARVMDDAVPLSPLPYDIYTSPLSPTYVTSANPSDTGTVGVPYFGPDAPIMRPYGHITVQVMVYRKLSTGRYATVRFGCMEWEYVVQPAASVGVTDPRTQGACTYDPIYLADDTLDNVIQSIDPARA